MVSKAQFLKKLPQLESPGGFQWELINDRHTEAVVRWRNDLDNLRFFEEQKTLTKEDQKNFLERYDELDRVDLVLCDTSQPIGVFNIKNLGDQPEFGALIGEENYRGQGIGLAAKRCLLRFWFNHLEKREIYTKNKLSNERVLSSNLRLGFKEVSRSGDQAIMVLNRKDFLKWDLK